MAYLKTSDGLEGGSKVLSSDRMDNDLGKLRRLLVAAGPHPEVVTGDSQMLGGWGQGTRSARSGTVQQSPSGNAGSHVGPPRCGLIEVVSSHDRSTAPAVPMVNLKLIGWRLANVPSGGHDGPEGIQDSFSRAESPSTMASWPLIADPLTSRLTRCSCIGSWRFAAYSRMSLPAWRV